MLQSAQHSRSDFACLRRDEKEIRTLTLLVSDLEAKLANADRVKAGAATPTQQACAQLACARKMARLIGHPAHRRPRELVHVHRCLGRRRTRRCAARLQALDAPHCIESARAPLGARAQAHGRRHRGQHRRP